MISLFVTYTNGKIVVTDNGWIDQNYYNFTVSDSNVLIQNRIISSFESTYSIKSTIDFTGVKFFYKTCKQESEITSAIFDLGHFCVGVINALIIDFSDDKEAKEKERFKSDANDFIRLNYDNNVHFRHSLDDLKGVRFNAIISKKTDIYLLSYVTGSSQNLFNDDLRKSIVNFELASKSKFINNIKEMLTLINDECDGYKIEANSQVMGLLEEKTTKPPIPWSNKEKLLELI
ncbi:hypothetical protein DBR40_21930 [Pedobacter sp. KBW01]|uniref:hypothetical protein n=1 Tax=Pedobacter sp. KBW01 TaxID=2153364 RepID=UPI000F595C29|nr:hypothetical protein [Pedobacter sp. KBW01]RQO66813.1 hypothetical protein DBR40_21930 [Pedobacter sp. KBW01]